MTKYGSREVSWWGTDIAPPGPPQVPYPGYTPPPTPGARYTVYSAPAGSAGQTNMAVGLKSVGQLTLYDQISGFKGMTEVYNL